MSRSLMRKDSAYLDWVKDLSSRYRSSQIKAAISVNREMLEFYWSLGHDIVAMDAENTYGSGFFETLSRDLRNEMPNAKGFSKTNLKYMKRFYELFPANGDNRPQLGDDFIAVPWGHIKVLIDKCKDNQTKALFYIHETIENGWSRAVLLNHIDAGLFERQGKAVSNFASTLPAPQGDHAQELTRDPYQFDFLSIRKRFDERELKDALIDNIQSFLLELGSGFSFMGREYRLQVGTTEQWLDLLFYHAKLHCYVVVEVKVGDFEPAFIGQLGTYVTAVNHILKDEADQPTIGLLICKTKDNVLARYAAESSSQPIGISEFQLSRLLSEKAGRSLPTIEEIESELQ